MSRKENVLGDVLSRYGKLMRHGDTSLDSRDRSFRSAKDKRHSSARRNRRPSPSESSSTSIAPYDSKGSRKARAWGTMVRTVSGDIREKILKTWGDQPMILDIVDSGHKWRSLMSELELSSAARDDFLMLLQMMEDRHAQISSSSLKKIATEVGVHHVRRMLQCGPLQGGVMDAHFPPDFGMGGPRGPPVPVGLPSGPPMMTGPPSGPPMMTGGFGPPAMAPGDIYTDLKHGIDKIQDANFHLNMQTLTNAAQKTDAERSLFSELRRRNEDLKDTREDLKVDRLKLAKENAEQKQLIDQLQCDLKIANEVADQQSKRSRETEEATKRELESLDAGIKELEVKLCETSKRNAVLSEEKESYKAHNDALLKEVERQDKVIRKMGRQIDSYTTINSDFTHMVEPMFKLVRALKERLDEYDVMRERLCNNIRDIKDDKEYAHRVGDLVVEMTTSRLYRIMEQYTDNNGRLHAHIEDLQEMTRHMDKAMESLKDDVRHENMY